MFNKIKKSNKGYSIIELLFYLSLLAILTVALINSIIVMAKSFQQTTINTDFLQSLHIMERISREVKNASSIASITNGDLTLNTTNDLDQSITRRFELSGGDVRFYENGVLLGNLNTTHISVNTMNFTEITTAKGKAIKVFLQVQSKRDPQLDRSEDFYDTMVLRGLY